MMEETTINTSARDIFAKKLRKYFKQSGKTQKEIADAVGVSAPTFNDWLNSKKYPRIERIEFLADYFGVSMAELIEEQPLYANPEHAIDPLVINSTTVADRIKQLRIKANMTLEEVGNHLGISKSGVQKYEKGKVTNIPRDTVVRLASLFNVSPEYLMCFDNKNAESISEEAIQEHITKKYGKTSLRLLNEYAALSTPAKSKLLGYAKDLSKAEKFEKMINMLAEET